MNDKHVELHSKHASSVKKASTRMRLRRRSDVIHGEEDFRPREMVPWFHPVEMARTAVRVLLANVVTTYSDSRLAMTGSLAGADQRDLAAGRASDRSPSAGEEDDEKEPTEEDEEEGQTEGDEDEGQTEEDEEEGPTEENEEKVRAEEDIDAGPSVVSDPTRDVIDLSRNVPEGGIWFDYAADTGEGFDSTFAVASILAREELPVDGLEGTLPRGQLLVLGGDMVYPWPSRVEYRDRFQVPFRWAMPGREEGTTLDPEWEGSGKSLATMAAIPGNHDWYDGLNTFQEVFCDGRRIGGWDTVQRRSYFAVKLPHGWMLWGADSHLHHRTDHNQRAYFRSLALDPCNGDKVILCTPSPAWLEPWGEARRNMRFFEEEVVRWPDGDPPRTDTLELPLVVSGDLHFYARYEKICSVGDEDDEGDREPDSVRHRIVCGGGGAYTRGTHDLPRAVSLLEREAPHELDRRRGKEIGGPDGPNRIRNRYSFAGPGYPDPRLSRSLALRALRFPLQRHNLAYCLMFGLLLVTTTGVVQWASLVTPGASGYLDFLRGLEGGFLASLPLVGDYLGGLLFRRPIAGFLPTLTMLVFLAFFLGSNPNGRRWTKWIVALAWMVVATLAFYALLFYLVRLELPLPGLLLIYGLAGGFLAGAITGLGLWLVNRLWGWNSNEVFSCQSIRGFKSFLRCNINKRGELVIYPIGIERVPRRWRRRRSSADRPDDSKGTRDPNGSEDSDGSEDDDQIRPLLVPVETSLRAHLIEPPIVIPSSARAP